VHEQLSKARGKCICTSPVIRVFPWGPRELNCARPMGVPGWYITCRGCLSRYITAFVPLLHVLTTSCSRTADIRAPCGQRQLDADLAGTRITSWIYVLSNALVIFSINRQLCELPAAIARPFRFKTRPVASSVCVAVWGHHSGVNLPLTFQTRYAHRRRRRRGALCNRPAVVIKQADSRSRDFTGDFDNGLAAG
jgi:hypothetical protein